MRPLFGFSMPPSGRDYPYGIPTSVMDNRQTNISTFSDNAVATTPLYNPYNASAPTINNMARPTRISYMAQSITSLNTTSMMVIRKQMSDSNLELINTLTQQMRIIFNPLIANTNQTYKLLANQMERIVDFFGTPPVHVQPTLQILNIR